MYGALPARYEMPIAELSRNMHPSENKFMAFLTTLDLRIRAQPWPVLCCATEEGALPRVM